MVFALPSFIVRREQLPPNVQQENIAAGLVMFLRRIVLLERIIISPLKQLVSIVRSQTSVLVSEMLTQLYVLLEATVKQLLCLFLLGVVSPGIIVRRELSTMTRIQVTLASPELVHMQHFV
jgi:hypothetical protein